MMMLLIPTEHLLAEFACQYPRPHQQGVHCVLAREAREGVPKIGTGALFS